MRPYLIRLVLQELLVDFPTADSYLDPLSLPTADRVLALLADVAILETRERDQ